MYEVKFSDSALKQFQKLEKSLQERIVKVLERIRIRPEVYLIKLVGEDSYRLRVGDYRIILDIKEKELLILVIRIGHRKNVYN